MLSVSPDVADTLARGGPVVALETTLVTHGLPRPGGLAVAAELEAEVRAAGALPATIGVLDGRIRVGLTPEELARLAEAPSVPKLNLANLAAGMAGGGPGSTTVAATVLAAHRAGIRVMATGGIGGVHRGAELTDDVSADLVALARFPVAVVCAGAKAVLDLPRTLERLETLGVPVLGFRTDRFPAFYRRDSGLPVDASLPDVPALARTVAAHLALGLGGTVVANPISAEHEMPAAIYEPALARAAAEAGAAGVRGRELTPFLLERMRQLTEGSSLTANVALLRANARLAGALAASLAGRGAATR
jgi:pseudouridine-5'-phosphate glycosidase